MGYKILMILIWGDFKDPESVTKIDFSCFNKDLDSLRHSLTVSAVVIREGSTQGAKRASDVDNLLLIP